jgi:hypothetical protein
MNDYLKVTNGSHLALVVKIVAILPIVLMKKGGMVTWERKE